MALVSATRGVQLPQQHLHQQLRRGASWRAAPFRAAAQHSQPRPAPRPRRAAARAQAAAAATAAAAEALPAWLKGRGGEAGACAVSPVGGLVAARPVPKGEQLYSIPEAAWMSAKAVAASPIGPAVAGLQPWLQLALFLLHERAKGGASEWAAYIAALPAAPDTPVLWSEGELAELQGSQLLGLVQGYRSYFQAKYDELQATTFASSPALFPAEAFGIDAFLWAVCTVRSRVHAPLEGDSVALVPLADLTQHRRSAGSQWSVKSSGVFGRSYALVMEAGRDLAAGEAVGMDYGPGKSDTQVLLDYGVLDGSSPQPGFALTLELAESDRFFDDKLDVLETNGLAQSTEFTLRPDQAPSETLLAFLRLLNLEGADAFLLESIFRNDVWGHLELPVSEDNERASYQLLIDGAAAALRGYPTSIDEDLALLAGGSLEPGSRREMAVRARLGEKEALDATLRYFEDRVGRLKGMEYYAERRLKRLGLLDDQGNTTWDGFFKDSIA